MHLTQAWLRDLWWLMSGPPLIGDGLPQPPLAWLAAQAADLAPRLTAADTEPEPPQARRFRIGRHAEDLLAWFFAERLVVRGLPIVEDGRTLGEIDLIFNDAERGLVHWEVAVKHFLVSERDDDACDILGPQAGQSLSAKVLHLRDHQLPLGQHPQVRATLDGRPLHRSEAFFRGWIFHPLATWRDDHRLGDLVHAQHPRGWWLRHGRDPIPASARSSRFLVVDRQAWIAPVLLPPDGRTRPLAAGELRAALDTQFRHQDDAVLVVEVNRDHQGWWQELARGFVVHAHWPTTVKPRLRQQGSDRHSAARSKRP